MKFEVINDKRKTVMTTQSINCIPSKQQCEHMIKAGYKFKLDNNILSKKKLDEFLIDTRRDK